MIVHQSRFNLLLAAAILASLIFPILVYGAEETPTYTATQVPFDPNKVDSNMASSTLINLQTGDPISTTYYIINLLLSLLGVAFLVLLVYGGTVWIIARGNAEEIEKAKKFIRNGLIGLIIVLASYSISAVVFATIATSYVEGSYYETAP